MTRTWSTLERLHREKENQIRMRKLLVVVVAEMSATTKMNARNLPKEKGNLDSTETQEEKEPTLLGKKMKLTPTLVTLKTKKMIIYTSWVT